MKCHNRKYDDFKQEFDSSNEKVQLVNQIGKQRVVLSEDVQLQNLMEFPEFTLNIILSTL